MLAHWQILECSRLQRLRDGFKPATQEPYLLIRSFRGEALGGPAGPRTSS